jgi:hypothetical protein
MGQTAGAVTTASLPSGRNTSVHPNPNLSHNSGVRERYTQRAKVPGVIALLPSPGTRNQRAAATKVMAVASSAATVESTREASANPYIEALNDPHAGGHE